MSRTTITCVLCALLGALAGAALMAGWIDPLAGSPAYAQQPGLTSGRSQYEPPPVAEQPPVGLTPEELANIRVYEAAKRGVVNITTSTIQVDRFFGVAQHGQGSGSGAIIDRQGHVVTNFHVIDDAREIQVTLSNGETYEAELVGGDAEYDIAVLKIDAPADRYTPLQMGRSDNLRVGQKAYAVGNPFGLEGTLTTGIVSSLNRSIPSRLRGRMMTSMIQTDAAMNPGNSGGPLLDSNARMVGVNVAIASKTGQNTGVGFAIPVNRVRRFLPELIERGRVVRAGHGIIERVMTPRGLVIVRMRTGGPAEKAGLRGFRIVRTKRQQGPIVYYDTRIDRSNADSILAIDGVKIESEEQFTETMDRHSPGDTLTFTILRNARRQEVKVTLGED